MGTGFRLLIRAAREFPLVRLKRASGGVAVVVVVVNAAAFAAFSSARDTQSHSPESHLFRTIWKQFLLNF